VPTVLVATKFDKLSMGEKERALAEIRRKLRLEDDAVVIPFSSITKEGLGPLWRVIDDALAG
jgi:GTP-binding protein EngB required for normal cell division